MSLILPPPPTSETEKYMIEVYDSNLQKPVSAYISPLTLKPVSWMQFIKDFWATHVPSTAYKEIYGDIFPSITVCSACGQVILKEKEVE